MSNKVYRGLSGNIYLVGEDRIVYRYGYLSKRWVKALCSAEAVQCLKHIGNNMIHHKPITIRVH